MVSADDAKMSFPDGGSLGCPLPGSLRLLASVGWTRSTRVALPPPPTVSSDAPLDSFRVRPRVSDVAPWGRTETRDRLLAALRAEPDPVVEVRAFPEFLGLHVAEAHRRRWSPRLILSLDENEDGTTAITGTYGPETEVWTVFLYGYLSTGVLGTFSGIFGGAQRFIGQEPWALYVTGTMAIAALLLYLGAQLGQKFGARQTVRLHDVYRRALQRALGET